MCEALRGVPKSSPREMENVHEPTQQIDPTPSHEPAPERHVGNPDDGGDVAQPLDHSPAAAAAASPDAGQLATRDDPADPRRAENFVTVCAWCPQLHILKLQLRDVDVLVIYKQGKELRIIRNGVNLQITHGICEPCQRRMR